MGQGEMFDVYFDRYCDICKHKDVYENLEPCNTCLDNPENLNSHKPIFYKPLNNAIEQKINGA